jgi:hypothetical protein
MMIKWFPAAFGLMTPLVLKNHYLWQGELMTVVVPVLLPFLCLELVCYEISKEFAVLLRSAPCSPILHLPSVF